MEEEEIDEQDMVNLFYNYIFSYRDQLFVGIVKQNFY